jgi:hypothetical protein
MTTVPEQAPHRTTSGRHSRPQAPIPMSVRPAPAEQPPVPEGSDVTARLFIPPQTQVRPQSGAVPAVQAQRDVVGPRPTGLAMKRRNPVGVWLGLPLITLGVDTFVWYYKIHREMAEFDRRRAVPVAGPMLVLLFLSWTGVATLVSFFDTGNRIANAQRAAGLPATCNPWVGLLLCFCFGLQVLYYQAELNKIVNSCGVPEGTEIALRA